MNLMRIFILLFLCVTADVLGAPLTPEEGLKRLKAGNERFVSEMLQHPNRTEERRLSLTGSQSPYAVIVTCSDSRVVPEVIFDEGLGDLFVIRVAGNVVGATELESIEYAVNYLQPVIVVVMGHEQCGAVEAVVGGNTKDIPILDTLIEPSVEKAKLSKKDDILKLAIELNAQRMKSLLLKSSLIKQKVQEKSIAVQAAYYNMQTGVVELLD